MKEIGDYVVLTDDDEGIACLDKAHDFALNGGYDLVCMGYSCPFETKVDLIKYGIFGFGYGAVKSPANKLMKREIYDKLDLSLKVESDEKAYLACQILYYADKIGYYNP
jgi:hypothetical protein